MGIKQMIRNRFQQRNEQRDQQWWPPYDEAADREAAAVIERARNAEQEERAGDEWLEQYGQHARDEDEAYLRNYTMDWQAAHINERVQGPGPGYEEHNPEIEANDNYLSWLDDEGWGQERGNPPDSRLRDDDIERAANEYPEPAEKDGGTWMPRSPGDEWTFEQWAERHGYTDWQVEQAKMLEAQREERLALNEGRQIVSEIGAYAADPQYADVKDQIEDIGNYVRDVMGLGDREPGQL
jgi:hypothetical protein